MKRKKKLNFRDSIDFVLTCLPVCVLYTFVHIVQFALKILFRVSLISFPADRTPEKEDTNSGQDLMRKDEAFCFVRKERKAYAMMRLKKKGLLITSLATETLLKLMKRFSLESKDDTLIFMI
jgi:hypothetical protein